jgi:hypothetical protein
MAIGDGVMGGQKNLIQVPFALAMAGRAGILTLGCRGKPAANKHRMNTELFSFADRLRGRIVGRLTQNQKQAKTAFGSRQEQGKSTPFNLAAPGTGAVPGWATRPHVGCYWDDFNSLALELFALQFKYNPAYQKICVTRGVAPKVINDWTQIPAVPTAAFKVLELSCIPLAERTAVFHSSGTTEQKPSRHFHRAESLAVYEASLLAGFEPHFGSDKRLTSLAPGEGTGPTEYEAHLETAGRLVFLTPGRAAAPHSSLVYMFDTVRRRWGLPESAFLGQLAGDGSWAVDFPAVRRQLEAAMESAEPLTLLGTAFSFVHLLDHLAEQGLWFRLPAGSRVMETGGYKNRSRTLPKARLHELIGERLGVAAGRIVCEYGMSELSSQAYEVMSDEWQVTSQVASPHHSSLITHHFRFPPWARVQIVSPETGREVADGDAGIIRVFDLANVFSVAAIQTEDLGVRRGTGFELLGRAEAAEPRGCSLMTLPG